LSRSLLSLVILAASGAGAQSAAPDLSGRDPHWIKDAVSNCWAANPHPEPGETITWTGACQNGLINGPGTLTWYLNGKAEDRDEGNFARGELAGHGRVSFPDGAVFEGEFPGKGVITLPDGRKIDAETIKEAAGWSIEQAQPKR
jgi:hypothetical protein